MLGIQEAVLRYTLFSFPANTTYTNQSNIDSKFGPPLPSNPLLLA